MNQVPHVDLPLSQFRTVVVTSLNGRSTSEYVVHESQLDIFVEAQKKLHFEPGLNPFNGCETDPIGRIRAFAFEATGPFWWSSPKLDRSGDAGATVFSSRGTGIELWVHPSVLEEERLQHEQELEAEMAD